ncbi:hypothetical protein [Agarivorans sp. DSG3-1]|uniref:hypothetical protein n=1 Tax=Agarivorans sp. DSG3-1 TaxID=3342249 RepID=UPI00398EA13F
MKFGHIGMFLGAIAFLAALASFWAGPFSPQPTIETLVAEKAVSIRTAALNALSGKQVVSETHRADWSTDKVIDVTISLLGGLATILAVVSFTQKEPPRIAAGAAVMGGSAITFQFVAMYVIALLVVLLILGALNSIVTV